MYGLQTLHAMNQRNAEAERIMRQYAKQDGRTMPEPEVKQEPMKRDDLADIGME